MADITPPGQGGTIDLRAGTAAAGSTGNGGTATASGQDPNSKFEIPQSVKQKYPELIPLILETESMNDDERQYWFQILPIMTDEQVKKLREILANEKTQLKELDTKYEKELKKINDKHTGEWKSFEAKEKKKKLVEAETSEEVNEKAEEEDLLKKLQDL